MLHGKFLVLLLLVAAGLVLQLSGSADPQKLVSLARQLADQWWFYILVVVVQAALFTFALPGSSMVWITAVVAPPFTSTVVITAGTTLGGIAAYIFSARLSENWRHNVERSRIYTLLKQGDSFSRLFALRIMPGFPHSVINYSSGLLKLKLTSFIPATASGTAVKTYLYSVLIFNAASSGDPLHRMEVSALWPLIALSLIILALGIAWHHAVKK